MVVDFRALNSVSVPQSYPLPVIQDILKDLSDTTYITTLDLTSGYFQIALHPNSVEKTSLVTPFGDYSFQRMTFVFKVHFSAVPALLTLKLFFANLWGRYCDVFPLVSDYVTGLTVTVLSSNYLSAEYQC